MLYKHLVEIYDSLDKTSKRLEKTSIISELLKKSDAKDMKVITLLLQGKIFPNYEENKIGVAARLILKAINLSTGIQASEIEKEWIKTGDLGTTAENLSARKKQTALFSEDLTVSKVFNNLRKISELEGTGSTDLKIKYISELLSSAKPREAKYITRTILEELRVGAGEGILRDAIAWAFFNDKLKINYTASSNKIEIENREQYNEFISIIQNAYDLTNDFGEVCENAKAKGIEGLKKISLHVGIPLKVMLAIKVNSSEQGIEKVSSPCAVEYKLDGFRMQIHKKDSGEIILYTRRLENVTAQFPEVISFIKSNVNAKTFILDSEAVGFSIKTGKYLPFQNISQRIKRKYDIQKVAEKFPVELNIFDILFLDGENLLSTAFKKRREFLEKIVRQERRKIVLAKSTITSNPEEAEKFYKQSLEAGNEGVMFKNLDAPYKPGARVGYMVKYKPTMETLDLVITSAEWGEGKRANFLSSYTLSCIDDEGNLLEVGKVSTGLKEKREEGLSFDELTEELKPLIISEEGKTVKVKPKLVLEVSYEEIQKSQTYSSGYALRFPRVTSLRIDRSAGEATSLSYLEDLYYSQKKAK